MAVGRMTKVDDDPVVGCEGICTGVPMVEVLRNMYIYYIKHRMT